MNVKTLAQKIEYRVNKMVEDATPEQVAEYERQMGEKFKAAEKAHARQTAREAEEAEIQAEFAAGNGHDLDVSSPVPTSRISEKLKSLVPLLSGEMLKDLAKIVAHKWRVRGLVYDPNHAEAEPLADDEAGDPLPRAGYRYLFRALTVHECDPDVLTFLRQQGGKGRVMLEFLPPTSGGEMIVIPFALPGEVDRPKLAVPMPARNDATTQALMQAMGQMFEMLAKQNEAILQAIQNSGSRKNPGDLEMLNRIEIERDKIRAEAEAARKNDPNTRMGAELRDMVWQSGMKKISDALLGVVNGQQAQPGAMIPMGPSGAPASPAQLLRSAVSSVKEDLAALPALQEDLRALAGTPRESTPMELVQQGLQVWGMFQALKSGNGSGMAQLMADMARMNAQGGMPGAPQNLPALGGGPANMPIGDAVLGDLAKKMAV